MDEFTELFDTVMREMYPDEYAECRISTPAYQFDNFAELKQKFRKVWDIAITAGIEEGRYYARGKIDNGNDK